MLSKLLGAFRPGAPTMAAPDANGQAQELVAAGNAAEDAGRLQEAHGLYARAVALAPALPAAHLNLGMAHEALGDAAAARDCYQRVLVLQPGHPFACYNLANLHYAAGRVPEAQALVRQALAGKGDFFQAWVLLCVLREEQGDLPGAADAIQKALLLQPGQAGALFNQAGILQKLGRLDEAAVAAERAAQLAPDRADCLSLHSMLLYTQGFAAESLAVLRRALPLAPHLLNLRCRELFLLNLVEGVGQDELYQRHVALGRDLEAVVAAREHPARLDPAKRLRIGFVSEDLRFHPVAQFLLPVLQGLTRERFEVICYSNTLVHDDVTRRVQALSDRWIEAREWDDAKLAEAIAADGIDVLVDLGGHTGAVRVGVFAAKPAPLQVSWVGYLNTTGLTRVDCRFSDARCDPPQQSQPWHTERLVLLPHSQWCYRPFLVVEPAPQAPCERNGHVTFGSLNNAPKLTEAHALRWGRILAALPTARLVVAGVESARKRESLLAAIERGGGGRGRVEFTPRLDLQAYYQLMNRIDIALDSHPYGGGTTTFDALWMGVPVLAATGATPPSRSAASVLAELGLQEWIAPHIDGYEALAVARAADTAGIARLRRSLRERLRTSALMDAAAFAAAFEEALAAAWRQRAEAPAAPGVPQGLR